MSLLHELDDELAGWLQEAYDYHKRKDEGDGEE